MHSTCNVISCMFDCMLLLQHQGHDGDSRGLGTVTPLWDKISHSYQGDCHWNCRTWAEGQFPRPLFELPVDLSKVLSFAQPESPEPPLSLSELVCSLQRHKSNTDVTETSLSHLLAVGS